MRDGRRRTLSSLRAAVLLRLALLFTLSSTAPASGAAPPAMAAAMARPVGSASAFSFSSVVSRRGAASFARVASARRRPTKPTPPLSSSLRFRSSSFAAPAFASAPPALTAPRSFAPPPLSRFQSSGPPLRMSIEDTPLGSTGDGAALLDGLDVHVVPAAEDGHPLAVYSVGGGDDGDDSDNDDAGCRRRRRHPVLLLHGRTWSSVPVYHLLGGPKNAAAAAPGRESRSLMEALRDAGLEPYAMDFRGFGGTPPDAAGYVEPDRCARDARSVLRWIAARHGLADAETGEAYPDTRHSELPALLGWSQGALIAQLAAQADPRSVGKLVLYGSIYDPAVRYPRAPLYSSDSANADAVEVRNTFDAAIEDFTVEGTIPPEPARLFAEAALVTDPIKARWRHLHQFNNCDPARVRVPTLVIAGDQDPYAPLRVQLELFANLGRGADRTWSVVADADHAVHLLDGRARFVKIVANFVECGRRGSESGEAMEML